MTRSRVLRCRRYADVDNGWVGEAEGRRRDGGGIYCDA